MIRLKFKRVLVLILLLSSIGLKAQKYDANWLFGYAGGPMYQDSNLAISRVHFLNFGKKEIIVNQDITMWLAPTNASISNENGDLLCYTNGIGLNNSGNDIIENGDTLNTWTEFGLNVPQGALILKIPESENKYVLFLAETGYVWQVGIRSIALKSCIIDMSENNGKGKVIVKNKYLIKDTLTYGKIVATKHANGRDWWIIVPERDKPNFYTLLLTPEGVKNKGIQKFPGTLVDGLGQACFSPNGKKYACFNDISYGDGQFLDIFDFDRCTGMLSNHLTFHNYNNQSAAGGVAISPNSRFVYFSSFNKIFQADLDSTNPLENMEIVAQYDGFVDDFPTRFFMAQLAPDGRIYLCAPDGAKYLHIIDFPDRKGMACNVRQHALKLPTYNSFSLPNFPNYRLGPLDGSSCDTLGITNIPVANFRPDQDTSMALQFEFNDLSYYEPTNWSWDFGDGAISSDTSPVHLFPKNGQYIVCLTVSNQYGSNTACDTLYLGVSPLATFDISKVKVIVYPNPASEFVNFIMNDYFPVRSEISLYNGQGILMRKQHFIQGWNTMDVRDLPVGIYHYEISDVGSMISRGKIMLGR